MEDFFREATTQLSDRHFENAKDKCAFCRGDDAGATVEVKKCRHAFHQICLEAWVDRFRGNLPTCPYVYCGTICSFKITQKVEATQPNNDSGVFSKVRAFFGR